MTQPLPKYLHDHPETIIALASFDLDLYEPTKKCLELIKPILLETAWLVSTNWSTTSSGETQALRDAWGLSNVRIVRDPTAPQQSYLVIE